MAAGLALGFTAGAFAAALTSLTPGLFTSDVALHPTMRSLAPQVHTARQWARGGTQCAATNLD